MVLKYMTPYNEYITNIITAVIVYFSAFSLLFKQLLNGQIKINFKNIFSRNKEKTVEEVLVEKVETPKKEVDE